jgi:hypothetical protein
MVAGWTFAAWYPAALLVAQFLSGMCMSALEGDMDASVAAGNTSPRRDRKPRHRRRPARLR